MKIRIFQEKSRIIENINIGESYYLLKFKTSHQKVKIIPGQFLNIRILDTFDPLLRRPFSIFNFERGIISILYKVRGKGTKILSQLSSSDVIDFIFPLGNGFKEVFKKKNIWIAAGGIGVAGISYLLKFLRNKNVNLFAGFNLLSEANAIKKILNFKNIHISVMQRQNRYFTGDILRLIKKELKKHKPEIIVGCGPVEMLESLYNIASSLGIPTEFLMERQMGCGMGVCFGCAIKVKSKNKIQFRLVCKDGPVFKGDEIVWS